MLSMCIYILHNSHFYTWYVSWLYIEYSLSGTWLQVHSLVVLVLKDIEPTGTDGQTNATDVTMFS